MDASIVATPYVARRESPPATVIRTGAFQSKAKRSLAVYGARQATCLHLVQRQPPWKTNSILAAMGDSKTLNVHPVKRSSHERTNALMALLECL